MVGIDDQQIADLDAGQSIPDLTHNRNIEGTGDNGDVRVRRPFLEHDRLQRAAVIVEKLRRPEVTRDQDEIVSFRNL